MENNQVVFENARILFRNFAGKEGKFNPAGRRNFCLVIPVDIVDKMKEDGWNVKSLPPRDPDDDTLYYIQVSVAYGAYPPKVWLVSGKSKTLLDEESIAALDYAEIENIDLIIRPYTWEVNGRGGVKAYLKKMYVTVVQDDLEMKYRTMEEAEDDDLPWND